MIRFPLKTVALGSTLSAGSAFHWYNNATDEEKAQYSMATKSLDFMFSTMSNSFKGLGQLGNKVVQESFNAGRKHEFDAAKAQISFMENAQKKTELQISELNNKIERTNIESLKRDLTLATQGDQVPYGGLTHIGYVGTILGTTGLAVSAISTASATSATAIGTGAFLVSGGVLGVGGAFLAIAGILRAAQPAAPSNVDQPREN